MTDILISDIFSFTTSTHQRITCILQLSSVGNSRIVSKMRLLLVLLQTMLVLVLQAEGVDFMCPQSDIIHTQCMGPKDCFYPHPQQCDQFIYCEVDADGSSGRPVVKDCPPGLEWNDNVKECDWLSHSTCPR